LGRKTGYSYWTGKKFSDEHKEKLRQAKLGKKLTEEHKLKIAKNRTPENIEKNRLRFKGGEWIIDSQTGKRKWV
jgi:hypothetical protein